MAIALNNKILADYLALFGFQVPLGHIWLIGIRGANPLAGAQFDISLNDNTLDLYNDTVGICGADWALKKATVEPGATYTAHPDNPKGAPHLLTVEEGGPMYPFVFGLHHGRIPALVQGGPFKVRRDQDRDGIAGPDEPIDIGEFGLHIHPGGISQHVGPWSEGCQVLWGGDGEASEWHDFYARLKQSGQTRFSYYLIDAHLLVHHLGLI